MVERALAALEEANSPWLIESLRFTGFFSPAATIEQDWWRRVVGAPSEAQTTRARIGGYQEAGLVDHRRLLLSVEPTRVDWRLTPARANLDAGALSLLGSVSENIRTFLQLMNRWLEIAPPMLRLAFGAALVIEVPNPASGYELLVRRYLSHLGLNTQDISDLVYQINRPRAAAAGVPGLRINRLTKWSVATYQIMVVPVGPGPLELQPRPTEMYASNLELDINTDALRVDELPFDSRVPLFSELAASGLDIALHGDVS